MRQIFSFGQCTPNMVAGRKSQEDFKEKELTKDVIWLMEAVKKLSVGIMKTKRSQPMVLLKNFLQARNTKIYLMMNGLRKMKALSFL